MLVKYAQNLKSKTIRAVLWSYASKYSSNLFLFISTLVLARLLVKEDFGIAGYALIVISFLEVLRGLGINSAIIFFPEDAERTNTGFWLTIGIGLLLFGLTWLGAPLVGQFFHDPRAIPVVRAMGLVFPINAFGAVHDALLRKKLAFNLSFIPNLTRGITKGFVSILLALHGFGVWSLVWGQLIAALTSVVAYWVVLPWRPALRFNPKYMHSLLSYGTKISIVNTLAVLLNNVDYLLIGRYFNAATLGIYTLAFRIPEMTIKQLYVMVSNVIFPAFAEVQHDLKLLRRGYFKTLSYVTIITVPMGLGLALVARPFVLVFLTDKWAEAIPVIPPIALYTVLRSVEFSAGALYKATGLTELFGEDKDLSDDYYLTCIMVGGSFPQVHSCRRMDASNFIEYCRSHQPHRSTLYFADFDKSISKISSPSNYLRNGDGFSCVF